MFKKHIGPRILRGVSGSTLIVLKVVCRAEGPASHYLGRLEDCYFSSLRCHSLHCLNRVGLGFWSKCCYSLALGRQLSDPVILVTSTLTCTLGWSFFRSRLQNFVQAFRVSMQWEIMTTCKICGSSDVFFWCHT